MEEETKGHFQQLEQKLDVISAILLRLIPRDINGLNLKEQIKLLDGLNVRPIDIAKIVGRSQSHVGKELVAIRKEK
ncbi:MAG: hypothetical protein WC878_04885 [Candidatus Paceibacterota bacterium]|jgi:hypothetical protein